MMFNKILVLLFLSLLLLASCARAPLKERGLALRQISDIPQLADDLELEGLIRGIQQQIDFLSKSRPEFVDFRFGDRQYTVEQYLEGLKFLVHSYKLNPDKDFFYKMVQTYFDFFEVYGRDDFSEVFITSYYEPVISGTLKKDATHTHALYRDPGDMVEINLQDFVGDDFGLELDKPVKLRGYIKKEKSIREHYVLAPTPSRSNIDNEDFFKGRKLEICYVDPVDAFFLQIQGSGTVILDNGERLRVGYDSQNGRKYIPVGKYLADVIPKEQMSLQRIERHLRSMPRGEMLELLDKNPSYVYFRTIEGRPVTTLGTEVVDGRTIATDIRFFPKGALAFLKYEKPVLDEQGEQIGGELQSRFVLDQDTGGAIYGGGRVDLFWGKGADAKRYAGVLKSEGNLFYLAPKKELLEKLAKR